jgi:transcriptional regulator
MFAPAPFRIEDRKTLHEFVAAHPFATLVSLGSDGLQASHVPLLLEGSADAAHLVGHLAHGNPQWRGFDGVSEALAVFHGPHAYVSPSWYATTPAVPTWNYAVVHAWGRPRAIEDPLRRRAVLERLVARFESLRPEPWRAELPADFRERMERGIVAFELPLERIRGKFKLGQNRPAEDQAGMLAGLQAEGGPDELALAAFLRAQGRAQDPTSR